MQAHVLGSQSVALPGLRLKLAGKMLKALLPPQPVTSRGPCGDRRLSFECIFLGPVMGIKPHRPRARQYALKSPGLHPSSPRAAQLNLAELGQACWGRACIHHDGHGNGRRQEKGVFFSRSPVVHLSYRAYRIGPSPPA